MARELNDAALLTIQLIVESPDEVAMVYEAPIVEFPNREAHEVLPIVREMHDEIADDFKDFVNHANDKIRCWIDQRTSNDWR